MALLKLPDDRVRSSTSKGLDWVGGLDGENKVLNETALCKCTQTHQQCKIELNCYNCKDDYVCPRGGRKPQEVQTAYLWVLRNK